MKVVNWKKIGKQETWNLTVDNINHNYLLKNGLVSKNSHSAAYSLLTYATAYLKGNYPIQFYTALMSLKSQELTPESWQEKISEYIEELKYFNIQIVAPDINHSDIGFFYKDNTIYFGLAGIKTVAKSSIETIMKERAKRKFQNIYDFLSRVNRTKLNVGKFEALIKAGCFDKLGYNRQELLENSRELYKYFDDLKEHKTRLIEFKERESIREQILKDRAEKKETGKLPTALKLKEPPMMPAIKQHEKIFITANELQEQAEYIGCYLGLHPTDLIKGDFTPIKKLWIGEIQSVKGIIRSIKKIKTKKGDDMAFISIEDSSGKGEATIFSNLFNKIEADLKIGNLVKLKANIESEKPIKMKVLNLEVINF